MNEFVTFYYHEKFERSKYEDKKCLFFLSQINPTKCTITSKINGTPKGVYLPIPKLRSILAAANLRAHNNLWFCYYGQVNSLWLKSNIASKLASKHFGGTIYFAGDGTCERLLL